MFGWTIAIISVGVISPLIQQIGNFQDEATCQRSLVDLKSQTPVQHKMVCVQYPTPTQPTNTPPAAAAPSQSINSRDARK